MIAMVTIMILMLDVLMTVLMMMMVMMMMLIVMMMLVVMMMPMIMMMKLKTTKIIFIMMNRKRINRKIHIETKVMLIWLFWRQLKPKYHQTWCPATYLFPAKAKPISAGTNYFFLCTRLFGQHEFLSDCVYPGQSPAVLGCLYWPASRCAKSTKSTDDVVSNGAGWEPAGGWWSWWMFGQKLTGWKGVSAAVDGAILERRGAAKAVEAAWASKADHREMKDVVAACRSNRDSFLEMQT